MINPELYNRTVNILVDAYFKDTLKHSECCACAVGNIVAVNMGIAINKLREIEDNAGGGSNHNRGWGAVFCTSNRSKLQRVTPTAYQGEAKRQIDSTGYKWDELAKIEFAFETAPNETDWMFNGLMAVIDCLDKIHENTDTQTTTLTKSKFNKNLLCAT